MKRYVLKGFTRGDVLLDEIAREDPSSTADDVTQADGVVELRRLFVEFENENLNAVLKVEGKEDKIMAICPDLITVCLSPCITPLPCPC